MMFKSKSALLILLLIFITSCTSNRWDVDTGYVKINQSFNRFELDLFAAAENQITQQELNQLKNKYPLFLKLYAEGIMGFGNLESPKTLSIFNDFTHNKDVVELFDEVKKQFPNESLKEEKTQLKNAFKRYSHFFPERIVPEIVTMIASFNYSTVTDDSLLGIGLDTYLGAKYKTYDHVGIPKFKSKNFTKEFLVADALKAWLLTDFDTDGGKNLLEQMVFQGKIVYLLNALMPEENNHVFFNYNKEDLEWCKNNEGPIWFHFVDMELLFTSESYKIRKYMGDAPFVAGFPEGSPGRVGHWVGYKIVDAFMENNKELSLSDLMNLQDANKILRKSNYKPKR